MGLRLHGPRKLSNLEKAALHLVFNAYPKSFPKKKTIFDTLTVSLVPKSGSLDRGSYGGRNIKITVEGHPCADDLGYCSALGNTDILKPGNIDYLNTFVHECTHHWQRANETYRDRGPMAPGFSALYGFSRQELQEMKFLKKHNKYIPDSLREEFDEEHHQLFKEQHASAVATWFVIAWQLKFTAVGNIDLTTGLPGHSVGTVDRYQEIKRKTPNDHGRWVPRGEAKLLAADFEIPLMEELRNGKIFRE